MLIIAGLIVAVVAGVVMMTRANWRTEWMEFTGIMLTIVGGTGLLMALIALIFHPLEVRGQIQQYEAVRQTVESARAGAEIESAALQLKVAEMNQWLADVQYWNGTAFDLWIPDAVDALEPLR